MKAKASKDARNSTNSAGPEIQSSGEEVSLPVWSCRFGKSLKEKWTVGDRQLLVCDGESTSPLKAPVEVEFKDPKNKYLLHVLDLKAANIGQVQLEVTGYRPGTFKSIPFYIKSDGERVFQVKDLKWKIDSVVKQIPGQQPTIYRAGPFGLDIPNWYWMSMAAGLAVILLWLGRLVYRVLSRRRMLAKLKSYKTALSPYNQFNKDIRYLKRQFFTDKHHKKNSQEHLREYISELDRNFRLYMVRELNVPAHEWSLREIIKEMRRSRAEIDKDLRLSVCKILLEFGRAQKAGHQISELDWEQLFKISRKVAEEIHQAQRRSS